MWERPHRSILIDNITVAGSLKRFQGGEHEDGIGRFDLGGFYLNIHLLSPLRYFARYVYIVLSGVLFELTVVKV